MNTYRVRKTKNPLYGYIVFATSYESPFDYSKDIEQNLRDDGYCGIVIFDLLLSKASTTERFLQVPFDGTQLALWSAERISDPDVAEEARSFYQAHFSEMDTTILSKPMRFKLRKGLPL